MSGGWEAKKRKGEELAARFAAVAPVGTPCRYYPVLPCTEDDFVDTRIRSEPWMLGGSVVVAIEGRAGGVSIEHIVVPGAGR